MKIESFPVDSEYDECFHVRLDDEDIGEVYAELSKSIRWFYYHIGTEVNEGPFPSRRAATKALARMEKEDYGMLDDATIDEIQAEVVRLLDASYNHPDHDTIQHNVYRFGIATATDQIIRLLKGHPLNDPNFHANEVQPRGGGQS